MPQWRKLYTKTTDSLDVNDMPDDFTRLLWVLIPLKLDSEGRGIDDASWVRSSYFPLRRDVTYEQIENAMVWFAERGMTERYVVDGRRYFRATAFKEYQGKTEREAPSKIPEPVKKKNAKVKTYSRPTQDLVPKESGLEERRGDSDSDSDSERESDGAGAPENHPAQQSLCDVSKDIFKIDVDNQHPFIASLSKLNPPCTPENASRFSEWFMDVFLKGKPKNQKAMPTKRQIPELWKQAFLNGSAPDYSGYDKWATKSESV